MEVSIYRNGKEDLSRVYIGIIPQAISRSGSNWKKYSNFSLTENFAEVKDAFFELLNMHGIEPIYFDGNSSFERFGAELRIPAEKLAKLLK